MEATWGRIVLQYSCLRECMVRILIKLSFCIKIQRYNGAYMVFARILFWDLNINLHLHASTACMAACCIYHTCRICHQLFFSFLDLFLTCLASLVINLLTTLNFILYRLLFQISRLIPFLERSSPSMRMNLDS